VCVCVCVCKCCRCGMENDGMCSGECLFVVAVDKLAVQECASQCGDDVIVCETQPKTALSASSRFTCIDGLWLLKCSSDCQCTGLGLIDSD